MSSPFFVKLWQQVERELKLSPSDLIATSNIDFFRRTYFSEGRVLKIVLTRHQTSGRLRRNTLKQEYEMLKNCEGIAGIPGTTGFAANPLFDVLTFDRDDAEFVSSADLSLSGTLVITARMIPILFRLVARGISHNDLIPENVLVSGRGRVKVIDFDQASKHNSVVAAFRTFLGIPMGKDNLHSSLPGFFMLNFKRILRKLLPAPAIHFVKKRRRRSSLPKLKAGADKRLLLLRKAWALAQDSHANAPGNQVAYYHYVFDNISFPGERPWSPRWACLSAIADYSGKRVMELGCNIGLLSSSLLREKNCAAALGVDVDRQIIDSAQLVAEALDVNPSFRQVNFDDSSDWESDLASFQPDIVFALNVLNWVKDKERLLAFLGRFDELIFEGHDSLEIERARLLEAGFRNVKLVEKTERGREVLYCTK